MSNVLWRITTFVLSALIFVVVMNLVLNFASLLLPWKILSVAAIVILVAALLSMIRKALAM